MLTFIKAAVSVLLMTSPFLSSPMLAQVSGSSLEQNHTGSLQSTLRTSLSQTEQLLPAEEAFILTVSQINEHELRLHWVIAKNYYLYKDKFALMTGNTLIPLPDLPLAETTVDEFFGQVDIYRGSVGLNINVAEIGESAGELEIRFQGCAEDRYCYPLQRVDIPLVSGL